ncbi:lysyl endopeptidase precursor [unidentified eubacterium SCB49]|nr:lysyl endopeptidase precursor [unidentified eubacterium SCB49]
MKKILLVFLLFGYNVVSLSQNEDLLHPISWDLGLENIEADIVLDPVDLTRVCEEDQINDRDKSLPWRYGIERSLDLDLSEFGEWTVLANGDRIWRAKIISPDALNLSVNFNKFYLPEGTSIYLYNDEKDDVVTSSFNEKVTTTRSFGSWFVKGESINIEYYEPAHVQEQVVLKIDGIIHGYRLGKVNKFLASQRGLNDSGDCNYDVNCSVGSDFDINKEAVKKAVALLNLGNGFLCSAVLINNTQQDKTPYLLTANHCLEGSDPAMWSVRFNWMSPTPICAAPEESEDIHTNFTMSGAVLRANNALSDFALVELVTDIPQSWDVSFAGWDRSDDLPEFEVGIHHPKGDIMKVTRDDSGAVHENADGTSVWLVGGVSSGAGDGWEIGTTESGSSGSPLFNQDGLVIGQLYGGNSFCEDNENNKDYDLYGRFATSWDAGDTQNTRLLDWLDAEGVGVRSINTLQNILNVVDNEIVGALEVYPNPASDVITIMNSRYPNLSFSFYDLLGKEVLRGTMSNTFNYLSVTDLSEGVYLLRLVDEDSEASITKKILIQR